VASKKPFAPGQITVICGSMFAGKSEELIRRARRALYAKRKVQVFKPSVDNRYHEQMVVTHMGMTHDAVAVRSVQDLCTHLEPDAEVICIEEAQFFDPSIVDLAVKLADQGKEVILAGLDQDFRRKPFGPMTQLLCVADEVVKLRAICMKCGAPASHTYRQIDGRPARDDDPIVLVGDTEIYEARCRSCFKLLPARRTAKARLVKPKGPKSRAIPKTPKKPEK
jgi:thymidine kinase